MLFAPGDLISMELTMRGNRGGFSTFAGSRGGLGAELTTTAFVPADRSPRPVTGALEEYKFMSNDGQGGVSGAVFEPKDRS